MRCLAAPYHSQLPAGGGRTEHEQESVPDQDKSARLGHTHVDSPLSLSDDVAPLPVTGNYCCCHSEYPMALDPGAVTPGGSQTSVSRIG